MFDPFDRQFQDTMDKLHFSSRDKTRLCIRLTQANQNDLEGRALMMKKRTAGKVFAVIAACLMITAGTALAASRIMWYEASSHADYDYHTPREMAEAQTKAQGSHETPMPELPDLFNNGFRFDGGVQVHVQGKDEAKNTLGSWEDFHSNYVDKSGAEITIAMSYNEEDDDGRSATEERTIGGVVVSYNHDEYLFLPDEKTELDAETKERMENDDHFFVSYGSDEPETSFYSGVSFRKDGITYSVFTMDEVSADSLYSMAEELIER